MYPTLKAIITLGAALLAIHNIAQARSAVLVTHYGSSDSITREKTIDRITDDIRKSLSPLEVREAYISPVVRRNLSRHGVNNDSPLEALIRLRADGYDTVYVQSTTLIDGVEMAEVRQTCDVVRPFFALLKCSESLCHTPEDCEELVRVLADEPRAKDEAIVFVGHGNLLPGTATYTQLDYMLMVAGHEGYHVSTIEGYPTAETTATQLQTGKYRRVQLIPLLLVCGNHTRHDIAGEFADVIRAAGYETEVVMRGLAESEAIRKMYVARAQTLIVH